MPQKDGLSRRTILKSSVGAAGVAGASGMASAKGPSHQALEERDEEAMELLSEFDDIDKVARTIGEKGAPVLETLSKEGFLTRANTSELNINNVLTERGDLENAAAVSIGKNKETDAWERLLVTKTTNENLETRVGVNADADVGHATVFNTEEMETEMTVKQTSDGTVTTAVDEELCDSWGCTSYPDFCNWNCTEYPVIGCTGTYELRQQCYVNGSVADSWCGYPNWYDCTYDCTC